MWTSQAVAEDLPLRRLKLAATHDSDATPGRPADQHTVTSRRVDQSLFAVIMEAYLHGTSTRKVDDLVKGPGRR